MADTGWLNPSAVDVLTANDVSWSNDTNLFSENAVHASAVLGSGQRSDLIHIRDFGAAVPLTATIDGYEVRIVRNGQPDALGGEIVDRELTLYFGAQGADRADTGTAWPGSDTAAVYGGPTDDWGLGISPADVNDENFGVAFSCESQVDSATANVDVVQVKIYYTEAAGFQPAWAANSNVVIQ